MKAARRISSSVVRRVELTGLGWLVGAVGAAGFLAAFEAGPLVLPAVLGGLVGALAAVGGRDRVVIAGALLTGLAAVGTLPALGAAPTVLPAALGSDGLGVIRDAVSVPATPETLAVPYLAAALAAFVAVRTGRREWRWPALLPSFCVLLLGLLLGDPAGPVTWQVPAAWVAVALLSLSWRSGLGISQRLVSTVAKLAVLGVVVVAVAVPVSDLVPVRAERAVVPHTPGAYPVTGHQPLARMVGLRSGDDDLLFTAETTGPVFRWRLTTLDRYDGVSWSRSEADYRPTAERLPAAPGDDEPTGPQVTQSIELNVDDDRREPVWGSWLPVADGPVETSRNDLLYDRATSSVALREEASVPERYEVTSRATTWDDGALHDARAADDAEARANLGLALDPTDPTGDGAGSESEEVDHLLDELDQVAETITAGARSDHGRAVELSRYLTSEGELLVEEDTPSGHTLHHVHTLLLNREGMQGTAEQYVSAFAVLARRLDLPARVVVGFEGSGSTGVSEVRASDATAWVEVRFDGIGWVPFDAVPTETGEVVPPGSSAPEEDEPEELDEAERTEDTAPEPDEGETDTAGDEDGDTPASDSAGTGGLLIPVLVVAALLLTASQVPALRRLWRRRRHSQGVTPAERVAGAWSTVLDDLALAGVPGLWKESAGAVVTRAGRQIPAAGEELVELSALANRSAFSGQRAQDTDGDRAWTLARSIVTVRRAGRTRLRRIREHFHW